MNNMSGGSIGRLDMINQLPDEVLSHIISSLSIDEAVRSSTLSQRWKPLWKHVACLDLDGRHMINPMSQNSLVRNLSFYDPNKASEYAVIYDRIVRQVLHDHLGNLISCRFKHFRRNFFMGDMKRWVEFVILKKRITSLSLECVLSIREIDRVLSDMHRIVKIIFKPKIFSNLYSLELTNYGLSDRISSAFESCEKLTILKLKKVLMSDEAINGILDKCLYLEKFSLIESNGFKKLIIMNSNMKYLKLQKLMVDEINVFIENLQDLVLNSLICPTQGLGIFTPKLKSFLYVYDTTFEEKEQQVNEEKQYVLKTQDILENCSHLLGSRTMNIFENLSILSIDLDLNNIREILSLSFVLKSCLCLQNLEITIPVAPKSNDVHDECTLPFPNSIFWERDGIYYNCINYKLKYAVIKGFTGREQEVKFVKHLIANANMIKQIIIICNSGIVDEAKSLLSLPRASPFLSITLKRKFNTELIDIAELQNAQLKDDATEE